MDRIKIEEITKDKIAAILLQGWEVICIYPYYNEDNNYCGITKENLLTNSMYNNSKIINKEGARFFIVKVSPEIESGNNE